MATPRAAWGIEIGASAIKAIRLERDGEDVRVSDFSVIPHRKVLTTPDLDQDEMIRLSLGQFISQKSLEGEHLVMSVPGHAAFARFAKLPPVEPKKVPDIVKFEAVQQIPFPIDEVEWDYQTFHSENSPEVEVGIFAITRDRVQQRLGLYGELGLSPESLTLGPVAIYNSMAYDLGLDESRGPIIFLDIGTQATDVVIADQGRCWIRTFPLGGTHFTDAIANAFKLSYSKAEKLKREASSSKYAKQIMQAMRPVFSDLLQDLQRSIGYFSTLHRERELTEMVGIGSTFKIPGLRKFIGQQLQINVSRLDEYHKIAVTGREAASFAEHTVNMATAYGLALQGVGLAPIAVNLVPVKVLREQMWHSKTKWFAAAAAIIVAGAATTLYHPLTEVGQLQTGEAERNAERAISDAEEIKRQYDAARTAADVGAMATNMVALSDYRNIWPHLVNDVSAALASADPQPALLKDDVDAILAIDPEKRKLIQLEDLIGDYVPSAGAQGSRRIRVTMTVQFSHADPTPFINETIAKWLRENAEPEGDRADVPYRIIVDSISENPTQRSTFLVSDDGTSSADSGGGSSRTPPPDSGPPDRPPRQAPGPGLGGNAGGSFGGSGAGSSGAPDGGMSGGAGPGRRQPGRQRAAPGPGDGGGTGTGGNMPSGGGLPPPGPTGSPSGPGRGSGGRSGSDKTDLDTLAPMPEAPSLFPPGSRYYQVPITFEVEIIDPNTVRPPAPETARRIIDQSPPEAEA